MRRFDGRDPAAFRRKGWVLLVVGSAVAGFGLCGVVAYFRLVERPGYTSSLRPTLSHEYVRRDVPASKIVILLDGVDVTDGASTGLTAAWYRPDRDLSIGGHRIQFRVTYEDAVTIEKSESFAVEPGRVPIDRRTSFHPFLAVLGGLFLVGAGFCASAEARAIERERALRSASRARPRR